jgi:hypothetical protein
MKDHVLNRNCGFIQYKNMQFLYPRRMALKSYFMFTLVLVSVWRCNHDQNAEEKTDRIFNIEIPAEESNCDSLQLSIIINALVNQHYMKDVHYFENGLPKNFEKINNIEWFNNDEIFDFNNKN